MNKINTNNFEMIFSRKTLRLNQISSKTDIRDEINPVGLLNVHNCCYLNSLLQCYFLSSDLVKYVFEAEPLTSIP